MHAAPPACTIAIRRYAIIYSNISIIIYGLLRYYCSSASTERGEEQ